MQLQGFSACSEARFKGGAQEARGELHKLSHYSGKEPCLIWPPHWKAAEKTYRGLQHCWVWERDRAPTFVNPSQFNSFWAELTWIHKCCGARIHFWADLFWGQTLLPTTGFHSLIKINASLKLPRDLPIQSYTSFGPLSFRKLLPGEHFSATSL